MIRRSLIEPVGFNVKFLEYGYKEIVLSAADSAMLDKNFLHIWPRKDFMLMGLANLDGSFTLTVFTPLFGEFNLQNINTEETSNRETSRS